MKRVFPYFATALLCAVSGVPEASGQTPGFAIDPPAGWAASTDAGGARATLARDSADLTAGSPAGPRIRIARSDGSAVAPEPEIDRVVEDPSETTLGGRPAVAIGLETKGSAGSLRRRILVSSSSGSAWRVDLEAPGREWSASIGTMETAVAGARVGDAGPIVIGPATSIAAAPGSSSMGGGAAGGFGGGGGGAVRRRGIGGGTLAVGALLLLVVVLLGALLVARRGGLSARPALTLDVLEPGGSTRRVPLRSLPAVIGRDPGCEVVLSDPEASRRHARLHRTAEGVVIEDLDSAAGTTVSGQPVRRAVVPPGGEIALGRTRIRIS